MIEMQQVQSSNITRIGFDAAAGKLYVEFTSGTLYEYEGIAPELFESFMKAESKGRFFGAEIRPKFTGTRIAALPGEITAQDPQAPVEQQLTEDQVEEQAEASAIADDQAEAAAKVADAESRSEI